MKSINSVEKVNAITGIFNLTIGFLAFFTNFNSFAERCVITGEMEAKYYNLTGQMASTQTTRFEVTVGNGHWLLKSEYTTNWFWLVGGDGTNTYSVLIDPKAPHLPAPGTVFSGSFPRAAFDTVSVPWLAFCSFGFLEDPRNRESLPAPWLQAQLDPIARVCSTRVTQFEASPHLPEQIEWVTSSGAIINAASNTLLRIEGASSEEIKRRGVDYQSNFLAGKLLGNYQVLATTNLNGLTIPIRFELKAYGYLMRKQREFAEAAIGKPLSDTYLSAIYQGKVVAFSADDKQVTLPQPGRPLSVTDYRLASRTDGIDYVSYLAKQWITEVNGELRRLLEEKKRNPAKRQNLYGLSSNRKGIVRVVLGLIFLAPLLVWGARKLRKNRHHTE